MDTIDEILSSAEKMGVFLFVITGGEPLMKDGILDIFKKHKNLLMITNGTLMNENVAREIANARNIIPVVSIESTLDTLPRLKFVGFCDQR